MRTILHILCEGQTEERFVKEILKAYFRSLGVFVKCILVTTSSKKGAQGGVVNFQHVKGDLEKWMKNVKHEKDELHFFTTMIDFYKLPTNFPSYQDAMQKQDPYLKVSTIEEGLRQTINNPNFIPYIQLHEFETLLFADLAEVEAYFQLKTADAKKLAKAIARHNNPELVNGGFETAPSKRIKSAIDGYKKSDGVEVLKEIGLQTIRSRCKHFNDWLQRIEESVKLLTAGQEGIGEDLLF